jgi:hypothetical protein
MSRGTSVSVAVVLVVLVVAAQEARAETGWAGSVRLGVGAPLDYSRAGQAAVDMALNIHLIIRPGSYEETWGGGPFIDAHTLGFSRHDITFGGGVSTPDYLGLFAGGLRVGAGYRWLSDDRTGGIVHTTFVFGFRIPIKNHEEIILGIYADARVLTEHHPTSELTSGVEIDPVGILSGLFQGTKWQPSTKP